MIQLTPQTRILVATEPADFRMGIDGFCRLCRERLQDEPFSGALFVFRNRRSNALKILAYDGQGFWLCQKRLSEGKFRHWPSPEQAGRAQHPMLVHELQTLLAAGNPDATQAAPQWRRITPTDPTA